MTLKLITRRHPALTDPECGFSSGKRTQTDKIDWLISIPDGILPITCPVSNWDSWSLLVQEFGMFCRWRENRYPGMKTNLPNSLLGQTRWVWWAQEPVFLNEWWKNHTSWRDWQGHRPDLKWGKTSTITTCRKPQLRVLPGHRTGPSVNHQYCYLSVFVICCDTPLGRERIPGSFCIVYVWDCPNPTHICLSLINQYRSPQT